MVLVHGETHPSFVVLAVSKGVRFNYLSPKAEARPSGDKGWGSFAIKTIEEGEVLACFGGPPMDRATFDTMDADRRSRSIQIDDDLFILGPPEREPGDSVNHSCSPNGGMRNAVQVVAMRRIEPGEELSFDYAMADGSDYDEFECQCGTDECRGRISGSDWSRPELQQRYRGYFSPYLQRRIDRTQRGVARPWRSVVTLGLILVLLWGALWGQDDHFPFGPFRMYATTQQLDGRSAWYSIYGETADGERVFLTSLAYGLRRAEIEGQTNRLVDQPDLLCLIGNVAQSRRDLPELTRVVLVREWRQLENGRPVGATETEDKASCEL